MFKVLKSKRGRFGYIVVDTESNDRKDNIYSGETVMSVHDDIHSALEDVEKYQQKEALVFKVIVSALLVILLYGMFTM